MSDEETVRDYIDGLIRKELDKIWDVGIVIDNNTYETYLTQELGLMEHVVIEKGEENPYPKWEPPEEGFGKNLTGIKP